MTKRNVMIQIATKRVKIMESLFDEMADNDGDDFYDDGDEPETMELWTEGRLITSPTRVELVYDEGESSGMQGSVTSIGFDRIHPSLVSMVRSGLVSTAMVFEREKRHFSLYDTPFSSFQICVRALTVDNRLLTDGELTLDYQIEVQGAQAEKCLMTLKIHNDQSIFPE